MVLSEVELWSAGERVIKLNARTAREPPPTVSSSTTSSGFTATPVAAMAARASMRSWGSVPRGEPRSYRRLTDIETPDIVLYESVDLKAEIFRA